MKIVQDVAIVCNFQQGPCSMFQVLTNGDLNGPIYTTTDLLYEATLEIVATPDNKTLYAYRSSSVTPGLYVYKIDLPFISADNVTVVYNEKAVNVCNIVVDFNYRYLYGFGCGFIHQYDISNFIPVLLESSNFTNSYYMGPKPAHIHQSKLYLADASRYGGSQVVDFSNGFTAESQYIISGVANRLVQFYNDHLYFDVEFGQNAYMMSVYDPVNQTVVAKYPFQFLPVNFIMTGNYMITTQRQTTFSMLQLPASISNWTYTTSNIPYLERYGSTDPHDIVWYKDFIYVTEWAGRRVSYFNISSGLPNGFQLLQNLTNPQIGYGYWKNSLSFSKQSVYISTYGKFDLLQDYLPIIDDSEKSNVIPIYFSWSIGANQGSLKIVDTSTNQIIQNCTSQKFYSGNLQVQIQPTGDNPVINFQAFNNRGGQASFEIFVTFLEVKIKTSAGITFTESLGNGGLIILPTPNTSTSQQSQSFSFSFGTTAGLSTTDVSLVSTTTSADNDIPPISSSDSIQQFLIKNLMYFIIAATLLSLIILGSCAYRWYGNRRRKILSTTIKNQNQSSSTDLLDISSYIQGQSTFNDANTTLNATLMPLSIPAFLQFQFGSDFRPGAMIAKGGTSSIFHVDILNFKLKEIIGSCQVVVKVLNESNEKILDKVRSSFYQEIGMYYQFRQHKSFPAMYAFSDNPMAVVLKYYNYGNLLDFILGKNAILNFDYNLIFLVSLLSQFSSGIRYIHEYGYAHLDIKPENVLLDTDEYGQLIPIIIDFGVSKLYDESKNLVKQFELSKINGLTLIYASPEMFNRFKGNNQFRDPRLLLKSDVYSTGIMIYDERICRFNPYGMNRFNPS